METLIYNISLMAGQTFWYEAMGGTRPLNLGKTRA